MWKAQSQGGIRRYIPSGRPKRGQMLRVSSGQASSTKSWPNQRCGSMTAFSNQGASEAVFKLFFSLFVFLFSTGTIKLLLFIQISTTGEKVATMNTPIQSRLRESANPSPTFCAKMRAFVARLRHWYTAVWQSYIVFPTALFRLCTDVNQKVEQKGSHFLSCIYAVWVVNAHIKHIHIYNEASKCTNDPCEWKAPASDVEDMIRLSQARSSGWAQKPTTVIHAATITSHLSCLYSFYLMLLFLCILLNDSCMVLFSF